MAMMRYVIFAGHDTNVIMMQQQNEMLHVHWTY